ncbi:MAG TPA: hypothetical protein VK563_15240 [Puia sp.]|nr:hypothetical protein [Puia sp.]
MKLFPCCLVICLCSCASQPYFKSPNDVYKKKVVLYLRDQPAVAGLLTVPFEDNFNREPAAAQGLKFIPEGKSEEKIINIKAVIGYSINKNYYALKELFLFTNNKDHLLFAKRLTREDSKIQLYELYESGNGNVTGETQYSYYISLPASGQYETINTKSNKLIPNFDQKMSELVADCPSLVQKIKEKQNGYFVPLLSFNTFKHKEVMTKIIDEYNNCK